MWIPRHFELALSAAVTFAAPVALAADAEPRTAGVPADPLAAYRERFQQGMQRYRAGAMGDAIGYWEPVYRELGAQKGYRLAYDLGVAYAETGDVTRAAERLQAFLEEADAKASRGETVDAIVAKEQADARARIAGFLATRGRIRIDGTGVPVVVQVDSGEPRLAGFLAWVAPGAHAVTFAPGTKGGETRNIDVGAGELISLTPSPSSPPPAAEQGASAEPLPASSPALPTASPERPATHTTRTRLDSPRTRPFSPAVIYASSGLTVVASVAAIALEARTFALRDRFLSERQAIGSISQADRDTFGTTRSWAYGSVGGSIGLGALTAGLIAWYYLRPSTRLGFVTPTVAVATGGAVGGVDVRF